MRDMPKRHPLKRARRLAAGFLAVGAVGLLLAACGSSSKSASRPSTNAASNSSSGSIAAASNKLSACPATITIGVENSDTGVDAANGGLALNDIIPIWVSNTNASGGIDGHKVKVDEINDATSPVQARGVATQLSTNGGITLVIGPIDPGLAAVTKPIYSENKKIAISPSASGPAFEGGLSNYQYTLGSQRGPMMALVAKYLKSKGITKVALIYQDDAYGKPIDQTTMQVFSQQHIKVATNQSILDTATDASTQVAAMKQTGVSAVVALTVGPVTAAMLKAMSAIGWTPTIAGPYGTGIANWSSFPALARKSAYAEYLAGTRHGNIPASPESARVGAQIVARHIPNINFAVHSYATLELAKAIIEQAHSCHTSALVQALSHFNGSIMGMPIRFTPTDHYGDSTASELMVVPGSNSRTNGLLNAAS